MGFAPLASLEDLDARRIPATGGDAQLAYTMLRVASAAVRRAAGCPISRETSTVDLDVMSGRYLDLPGPPVVAVLAVTVDGQPVSGWRPRGGRLWRDAGWAGQLTHCRPYPDAPGQVTVTYVHGLAEVPDDIVDLVCSLAAAGIAAARDGEYAAADPRVLVERIDDYSVSYAAGAEALSTVMQLPEGTCRWLASTFGTSVASVSHG